MFNPKMYFISWDTIPSIPVELKQFNNFILTTVKLYVAIVTTLEGYPMRQIESIVNVKIFPLFIFSDIAVTIFHDPQT